MQVLPPPIKAGIKWLDKRALKTDGIWKVTGNSHSVSRLVATFDQKTDARISSDEEVLALSHVHRQADVSHGVIACCAASSVISRLLILVLLTPRLLILRLFVAGAHSDWFGVEVPSDAA